MMMMRTTGVILAATCLLGCGETAVIVEPTVDMATSGAADAKLADAEFEPADMRGNDAGNDPNNTPNNDPNNANNPPAPAGPTRYLHGPLVQPITTSVVESMAAIRSASAGPDDGVFMKVGASGTVNTANLTCFGPTSSYRVDLDGRDELQATIDRFNVVQFAGQTSWDRTTQAAEVGRSAGWAQSGSPSPIAREISDLNPRFALVNYGTNDMQLGVTHGSALWPFYDNMVQLLDGLTAQGIVPILTGLNPRSDSATAALWVPAYNAATRALAESRQLPYIDLYLAAKDLPDRGLISDGIHGNAYSDGGSQPCVFTAAGLQFNYNVRNLLTLQLLDSVAKSLLDGASAGEQNPRAWAGDGSPGAPFEVDVLPFSHHADTSRSPNSEIDSYPGCDNGQNESGPEYSYRLELDAPTPLRIMLFDQAADIDVHLLDGATCVARNDRMIEGTFGPGTYTIVTDTFVSSSGPQAGDYSIVVVPCEPNDPDCS